MSARIVEQRSSEAAERTWRIARAAPAPALAPYVAEYCGWYERTVAASVRCHVPIGVVPMIINAHPGFMNRSPGGEFVPRDAFIAGLHTRPAFTRFDGVSGGVQVNLTPIAARLFTGLPMSEIANTSVDLGDVFGAPGRELCERIEQAPDWESSFRILDGFIAARLARAVAVPRGAVWAWRRIEETGGLAPIAPLADEVGWSRKHLVEQFRRHIGLPPKTLARVVRFGRLVRGIAGMESPPWALVAARYGYFDQAHLARDFAEFAGCTPREYMRRQLGGGSGMAGEPHDR
jgi:AraC-like DNA-binding protein